MTLYHLLFTGMIMTSDGAAITRHTTEFGSKKACVNAIVAETNQMVDINAQFPKVEIQFDRPGVVRDAPTNNFLRYVCVPKES